MEGLEGVERFVMVWKVVERLCWRQINVAICGDKKKSKSILGFSFLSPFFTITNYYFLTRVAVAVLFKKGFLQRITRVS